MDWKRAAQAKRTNILTSLPKEWHIKSSELPPPERCPDVTTIICRFLTSNELSITSANAIKILENVRIGTWSALQVTRAFCHRASLAHQLTNCLTEVCFVEAERRAAQLDQFLKDTGQVVGPLHGLPVSLKDRFNVTGLDSTCGYVSWIGKPMTDQDEGVLVKKLKEAGAIIFVKTNVPMSMLVGETTNNIIGSTSNPYSRRLTAGGASGGEGALLALGGSPLGWGSDIAGSIRIPCSFNNLFGIRPSSGRLPTSGLRTSLPGLPVLGSVIGPMCTDLESMVFVMKWILGLKCAEDDHEVINIPWNENKSEAVNSGPSRPPFVFGIMLSDSEVLPHPPIQRAMSMVKEALQKRGFEIVKWEPPSSSEAVHIFYQILGSTAGEAIRQAINASSEPPIPQLAQLYEEERAPLSATDFWRLCNLREQFRAQYHQYWKSTKSLSASKKAVDGVIMPIAAHAAPPEGLFKYYAYSALPSLLDYTAGSIPVTFADRSIDHKPTRSQFLSDADRRNWDLYDEDLFDGAPVGVQIMGQRLQEEKVVAMMQEVTDALQEYHG